AGRPVRCTAAGARPGLSRIAFSGPLGEARRLGRAPFSALQRVQTKAEFVRVLDELGLAYPATALVDGPGGLERWASYPCYVKLAYGTAGRGVWHVQNGNEMRRLSEHLESSGQWAASDQVLVQQPAHGLFCTVYAVFQQGKLLAAHSSQARATGVGGAAWSHVGVDHPGVRRSSTPRGNASSRSAGAPGPPRVYIATAT